MVALVDRFPARLTRRVTEKLLDGIGMSGGCANVDMRVFGGGKHCAREF